MSVNKLARVASIATKENEEALAEQVKLLPQTALETLVRDERKISENDMAAQDQNGLQTGFFEEKVVRAHNCEELELSEEVRQKLLELQQKGINVNELILEMLQKRELEIAQEKEQMAEEMYRRVSRLGSTLDTNKPTSNPSRYTPIKIKKLLEKEHGNKCSIPTCQKLAETIHHTQRFSLSRTHDPRYLSPLCKNHHIIAHSIDQKFQQKRVLAVL